MKPPAISDSLSRRDALKATIAGVGLSALAFEPAARAAESKPDPRRGSPKRYDMLKSINLWAFPYPERMTLRECLQLAKDAGFDGIELNYDLDNDLSPKSGTKEYTAIRKMADEIGIQISGLCSFLFWPYPLTSNDPAKRARGLELAGQDRARRRTISAWRTCSSCPAPSTSRGAPITSRCRTTCATSARRRPSASSRSRPRS